MSNSATLESVLRGLAERGIEIPQGELSLGYYGDSPEMEAELIELIVSGQKTATASLLQSYELDKEPLPTVGDIEIVVKSTDEPVAITRLTQLELIPFSKVSAEHAWLEGEGDRSLQHWRRVHWEFFTRESERYGLVADQDMLIVCERFEVLQLIPTP